MLCDLQWLLGRGTTLALHCGIKWGGGWNRRPSDETCLTHLGLANECALRKKDISLSCPGEGKNGKSGCTNLSFPFPPNKQNKTEFEFDGSVVRH